VAQFSALDDATWARAAESNVIAIPELRHDLAVAMSAAQRQSVVDLVNRGGTLLTVVRNAGFINQLFGLSLRTVPADEGQITVSALGNSFEGGPQTLPIFSSGVGLVPSTIPFRGVGIYLGNSVPSDANPSGFALRVTVMRPSNQTFSPQGQIIVLGFNWLQAQPTGPLDGGWNDVLSRSIRFASIPF
jgi:hypothetical protein